MNKSFVKDSLRLTFVLSVLGSVMTVPPSIPLTPWRNLWNRASESALILLSIFSSVRILHVHETNVDGFTEDVPTALWFTYRYVYSPAAKVATQRIRLNQNIKLQQIAHLTNHIFTQGYLPAPYRPLVYWETQCGVRLAEDTNITETLAHGFGVTEGKAIKLVVGELRRAFFFHCNITMTWPRRSSIPSSSPPPPSFASDSLHSDFWGPLFLQLLSPY